MSPRVRSLTTIRSPSRAAGARPARSGCTSWTWTARVLLDTATLGDTALLSRCLERWNERIAVSVDSRGGRVTVAGWLEMAGVSATDVAVRLAGSGVRTLVFTNVAPDGTLTGVDT